MSWRWVLAVGLMVLSACVPDPSPTPGSYEGVSPSSAVTTGTVPELSTTASVDEAEPLVIEVLGDLDPTLGTRVRELGNYGYGARPAVPSPVHDVPDLGAMFPSLTVREIDLNWGIDSSALLVTADGDPDVIDQAEAQLAESTRWVLAGENWVAGIYQGGLAARFEMEALVETISWIMDPASACQQGEIACPLGPEVGFPPPPPRLVVNDEIDDEAVPFEVVEIEGASLVEADGVSATWIIDGQAFTGWGDPSDPPETQARGPALVA
ncbi:MAG: hypothetical protein GY773_22360, partial [Actinomycetia bacterium]|nr:hypothetical protein [Actinomycetes bacterium]